MELNQWGDPSNTVYAVMMCVSDSNSTLMRVFKCWKAANDYAYAEHIKTLLAGHPVDFYVCAEALN